jgi:hypothetical protein
MSVRTLRAAVKEAEAGPISTIDGRCRFVVMRERRAELAIAKALKAARVAARAATPPPRTLSGVTP